MPPSRARLPLAAARQFVASHIICLTYLMSVVGIVLLVFVSYQALLRERQSTQWVHHTGRTIATLEQLHLGIVQAESAGRAYLLIPNESYSIAFDRLRADIADNVRRFRNLTVDNREQQAALEELQQIAALRFSYLESAMELRDAGSADEVVNARLTRGAADMRRIDHSITGMKRRENALLARRLERQEEDRERVALLLLMAGLGGAILLSAAFRYSHHLSNARRRAEESAVHLVHHDALTGLPNRRLLEDRLNVARARADRQKLTIPVLCLDLDGFKKVNDQHGHDCGDELLKAVADRLRNTLRAEDTIARLGGDEFAVVLAQSSAGNSVTAGEKLIAAVSAPYELGGRTITVGTSVGIALYPDHARSNSSLLRDADHALYEAKAAGKGCVRTAQGPAGRSHPGQPHLRGALTARTMSD